MKVLINECNVRGLLIEGDAGYISARENTATIKEVKENIKEKNFDFKTPVLYAVLQKYGVKNRNGRIYPKEILEREVENYRKLMEMGAAAGETDHASDAVISIKNTSMRIVDMWWDGITLMGKIYVPVTKGYIEQGVISHPADKIIHDVLHGFQYGVSSRGVGSLKNQGDCNMVQDDFELVCWDWVTAPSTHGSWAFTEKEKTAPHIERQLPKENIKYSKETINPFGRNTSLDDRLSNFMKNFK